MKNAIYTIRCIGYVECRRTLLNDRCHFSRKVVTISELPKKVKLLLLVYLLTYDKYNARVQERPIDTVVTGFIHLQEYHVNEIARGLSGHGNYRLQQGFPLCDTAPQTNLFLIQPDQIVTTLQQPTAEVNTVIVNIWLFYNKLYILLECLSQVYSRHLTPS